MEHKIKSSRASGKENWTIKCTCGRKWHGWRWLCEERFADHELLNEPEPNELTPLWWDDESYKRYQSMP